MNTLDAASRRIVRRTTDLMDRGRREEEGGGRRNVPV